MLYDAGIAYDAGRVPRPASREYLRTENPYTIIRYASTMRDHAARWKNSGMYNNKLFLQLLIQW